MSVIDAIIAKKLCGGGGGSVPKPLTYDYMPEGYPKKAMGTVTVMEEQALAFALKEGARAYTATLTEALDIVEGQTYTVNWDGTEYECVCYDFNSMLVLGNISIMVPGADTGEPFVYGNKLFATPDTAASHTISVKIIGEIVTPMAEEFIPNIPADKISAGGRVTTLHINVTAIDSGTGEVTFTADKTPAGMRGASANGPTWCVISFAAGTMSKNAFSVGLPPAWRNGWLAFGMSVSTNHDEQGNNKIVSVVSRNTPDTWDVDLSTFKT